MWTRVHLGEVPPTVFIMPPHDGGGAPGVFARRGRGEPTWGETVGGEGSDAMVAGGSRDGVEHAITCTAVTVGGSFERRTSVAVAILLAGGLLVGAALRPGWVLVPLVGLFVLAMVLLPWGRQPAWEPPRSLGPRTLHLHACRRVCIAPCPSSAARPSADERAGLGEENGVHLGTGLRAWCVRGRLHLTLHDGT